MKKLLLLSIVVLFATSCQRVAPNYVGVLMENYGKAGKSDFSPVKGRVSTAFSPGAELFQVPLFEQRAENESELGLKSSNNTEFSARPRYSYSVIEDRAVDVVFDNKQLGTGDGFMKSLENNILETRIYDITKELSKTYHSDSLMSTGGTLKFEKNLEDLVRKAFADKGLKLQSFEANLEFSEKVKERIDTRNEVNTNISVIDQQILEQNKRNELAKLQRDHNRILSEGLTPQILQDKFIDKWDGKTPLYGSSSISLMKAVN